MSDQPHYPYRDGDVAVLGPEVFATADGMTISWKGANYRRDYGDTQPAPDPAADPAQLAAAIARVRGYVEHALAADGPTIGLSPGHILALLDTDPMRTRAAQTTGPATAKARACRYCPDPACPENCPECGGPLHDLDAAPSAKPLVDRPFRSLRQIKEHP